MNQPANQHSLQERLGQEGISRLVDTFYAYMASLPEAQTIWAMHVRDLEDVKQRLRDFLSGFLGGPDLYSPKHGHPQMRRRHLGFSIGLRERDAWMACMTRALQDTVDDRQLRNELEQAFFRFADHMRNRVEEA